MVQEECHTQKISKRTQEEINGLWKEWKQKDSRGQEEFLDRVWLTACAAEENGFVMGFKYAFRLFAECMQE